MINSKDKPLAVYYFGKRYWNSTIDRLKNETSSGAYIVNDALF